MKNWKITMVSGLALLLMLTLATAAGAQQARSARQAFRDESSRNFGIREFVKDLQLSDAQKEDIRGILKAHRPEILSAREALLQARLALANEAPNGPADFGAAQARVAELRLAISNQIKTKLTEEQLAALQNRRQQQADNVNRALQNLKERSGN